MSKSHLFTSQKSFIGSSIGANVFLTVLIFLILTAFCSSAKCETPNYSQQHFLIGSCEQGTIDRTCFDFEKKTDRLIYCTNNGRSYSFLDPISRITEFCKMPNVSEAEVESSRFSGEMRNQILINKSHCNKSSKENIDSVNSDMIHKILLDKRLRGGRYPIYLVDLVFCKRLEIVGIDITQSLIFDRSYFNEGASFQYLNTAGNLSINEVVAKQDIFINRSKVSGGVFGRDLIADDIKIFDTSIDLGIEISDGIISRKMELSDSKVGKSLDLRGASLGEMQLKRTTIGSNLLMDRAAVTGRLSIYQSDIARSLEANSAAFSSITILNAKFLGPIIVRDTEVRCSFTISSGKFSSDLYFQRMRFNIISDSVNNSTKSSWSDSVKVMRLNRIAESIVSEPTSFKSANEALNVEPIAQYANIIRSIDGIDCKRDIRLRSLINIQNSLIDGNLFLDKISFHSTDYLKSYSSNSTESHHILSLSGSAVAGTTFLDNPLRIEPDRSHPLRFIVDLVNFKTSSLVIPIISTVGDNVAMRTSGLIFQQILERDSSFDIKKRPNADNQFVADIFRMKPPELDHVISWLRLSDTTIPHAAAISSLEKLGFDTKTLRVEKSETEWRIDLNKKFEETRTSYKSSGFTQWILHQFIEDASDYLQLIFQKVNGFVSDYGYRPQKALFLIVAMVLILNAWMRYRIGVYTGVSDLNSFEFVVGPAFVLDRMIPIYSLDERFGKIQEFRYSNGHKLSPADQVRLYNVIRLTKAFGVIAVIFVAASLKTLVVE